MKLLIENWKKFINEEELSGESEQTSEQEENTEQILSSDQFKEKADKIFSKNPELAAKVVNITKKYLNNSEFLSEEDDDLEKKPLKKQSDLEQTLKLASVVTFLGALHLTTDIPPIEDTKDLFIAFGAAGAVAILAFLAKIAREHMEKNESKMPDYSKRKNDKEKSYYDKIDESFRKGFVKKING